MQEEKSRQSLLQKIESVPLYSHNEVKKAAKTATGNMQAFRVCRESVLMNFSEEGLQSAF